MNRIPTQTWYFLGIVTLCLSFTTQPLSGAIAAWSPFVISDDPDHESFPAVHGNLVVWDSFVSRFGDWDVLGADINDPASFNVFGIGNSPQDEMLPDVWGNIVVYELNMGYPDNDIAAAQLGLGTVDYTYLDLTEVDSRRPRICGHRIVWNDYFSATQDWDPVLLDINDLYEPNFVTLPITYNDEVFPDLSQDVVIWNQFDPGYGASLWGASLWTPEPMSFYSFMLLDPNSIPAISGDWVVGNDPNGWIVADNLFDPLLPKRISNSNLTGNVAVANHIAVWEDYRNGNWDLYGYNLSTQTEFPIVTLPDDQIHPAIAACPNRAGFWVIWEDYRQDPDFGDIYGMWINGPEVALREIVE